MRVEFSHEGLIHLECVEEAIDSLKERLVQAVQACIRIPSVANLEERGEGAPFGAEIKRAMEWSLALGESLGFKTKNLDGYAGYVEMGAGLKILGILGHVDVVPAGDGWQVPPFGGVVKKGKVWGRGAMDDKGPMLAVLFAMKAIKDCGISLQKRVRLILGTDEESGWLDMDYYLQREEKPHLAFIPDAEFPVINAEKGVLHLALEKGHADFPHVRAIGGGERANVVPDTCRVVLRGIKSETLKARSATCSFPATVGVTWAEKGGEVEVLFSGVGAHGSLPQNGENAIIYALRFLQGLPLSREEKTLLDWVLVHPGQGYSGEGFGLAFEDKPSGNLSLNLGMLHLSGESLRLVLDIRYPVTCSREEVLAPIEEEARRAEFTLCVLSEQAPHYVPQECDLVQELLKVYAGVTGFKPYVSGSGGGSYAKLIPQAVAFGPVFPGEPDTTHAANEYISVEELILCSKIYARAILALAGSE
ncbi:Peptidase M20 [Acididesulfobacillus acetoxydans]|uniref:Beta-Ala-Xaa dipeptidase n=1 Tax=Acididesulfobacillus acetoxydans TaxID=1561005 RepID=A0A8S0X0K9_9FIRM|nr:dipeptidase PepV [Acididesulfobacillus acetoxydans]CAA7602641.1 Peptidase M20 [Acididesulfobacillus acetoxydans]CEJ09162.1 Beta-Ala-Xaa dipeptidase [Acididesulfobacillus acetoxydans]